jgi:hypothetical protein
LFAAFDFLSFGLGIVVGGPLAVGAGLLYAWWLHHREALRREFFNKHTFHMPVDGPTEPPPPSLLPTPENPND